MSERTLLTLVLTLTVAGFVALSITLGPVARTAPLIVGIPTLALAAMALRHDVASSRGQVASDDRQRVADERRLLGWLTLLIGLTAGAGVPIGVPLWLLLFLRFRSEETWLTGIAFSAGLMLALFVIFRVLLRIGPMSGSVITWFS
jgi:uncharacterized membrane protein YidH (DUF202 family)